MLWHSSRKCRMGIFLKLWIDILCHSIFGNLTIVDPRVRIEAKRRDTRRFYWVLLSGQDLQSVQSWFFLPFRCPDSAVSIKCVKDDETAARRSLEFYWPHKKPPSPEDIEMELQQSIAEQMEEASTALKRESFLHRVKVLVKEKRLRISCIVCLTMAVNHYTSGSILLSSYSTAILLSLGVPNELAKRKLKILQGHYMTQS